MVIVLIDVQVEGGVTVHVVRTETRLQSLLNRLVSQPLFQLRRPTHVVDDALYEETNTIQIISEVKKRLQQLKKRRTSVISYLL